MFTPATRNAKFQPRKLEEYEEVVGVVDRVEKQGNIVLVTMIYRQTFVMPTSTDGLLERLFESVGKHVALLCIDGTCRFRVVGHGA